MRIYQQNQIDEIAFELKNNKAVLLPTDTVYGLVSLNPDLIYKLKDRSKSKKLITFINDLDFLNLDEKIKDILLEYLPGALTIVYKKESYRIPNNYLIRKIIEIVGPVYSSSANISGEKPISSIEQAIKKFKNHPCEICFVDYECEMSNEASTIIDLDELEVIREGIINGKKIIEQIKLLKEELNDEIK